MQIIDFKGFIKAVPTHNPKVVSSNLAPATKYIYKNQTLKCIWFFYVCLKVFSDTIFAPEIKFRSITNNLPIITKLVLFFLFTSILFFSKKYYYSYEAIIIILLAPGA